jgi:hypothetical protein
MRACAHGTRIDQLSKPSTSTPSTPTDLLRAIDFDLYRPWSSLPITIYTINIAASSPPLPLMVIVNANKQLYFFY